MGLPKGSLNKKERGNTQQVFLDAGYDIVGYEPGKESDRKLKIANDLEIELSLCRPQDAPRDLSQGIYDVAIVGEDWVRERAIVRNGGQVRKIGDLGYGKTGLIIGVPSESKYGSLSDIFTENQGRARPVLCYTEYPNITRQCIVKNSAYQNIFGKQVPFIDAGVLTEGDNESVRIITSAGVTESYIKKADADFIVDNTQTGSALKEYGLRILEPIMDSSAGLYAGPACVGWKEEKAQEIYEMLKGAVYGKDYFDVKFNVPIDQVTSVKGYLTTEGLCADEPTLSIGEKFAQVNILIPRLRFPEICSSLKNGYGAKSIVRNEVKQYIE